MQFQRISFFEASQSIDISMELCEWLDLSPAELEHVLQMDGDAHPVTTWLVRDALDQAVAESGADAGGWSVLTNASRREARGWFRLQDVPPRP